MDYARTAFKIACSHCGDSCSSPNIHVGDHVFCCEGCKSVYQILSAPEVCEYYAIREHPGSRQETLFRPEKFAYLDNQEIARQVIRFADEKQTHVTFVLPQMHCSSCLWLLEHLSRLDPAIISSKVAFHSKEAYIVFDSRRSSLRKIVELLARIGYEPHLSLGEINSRQKPVATIRKRWIKIGLAGFCFSNIMMLSFPEYLAGSTGIEPQIASFLNALKIGLAIPTLFYAASEFFIQAWNGLKEKYLNIDAPIALALVITFGRSLFEILSGTGAGYLDSMSGIIFFMLIGRWLQDRTYRTISFDRDFKSFFPIAVNVLADGKEKPVSIEKVGTNERIMIHHGELIPMDSILSKGEADIDYSFVTGESAPVKVQKGEIIYAGGKQMSGLIELVTIKEASQSYLTHLWNRDAATTTNTSHPFIDQVSRYFTFLVFGIGAAAAGYWWWQDRPDLMWNALTTILIVACPCALLLAANFTTGNILRILSLNKFYLKNAGVLESLSSIDTIVFDKTGTLTFKNQMLVSYEGEVLDMETKMQLARLLVHSNHPLSKAVFQYLNMGITDPARHFTMHTGEGIEGWVDERHIRIGSASFVDSKLNDKNTSTVYVRIDQKLSGRFIVQPAYRPGLSALFKKLSARYHMALLSGDNEGEREHLEDTMGSNCELLFHQKPEDKVAYIASLQKENKTHVLMIGDGLNDVPALHESQVGIAVCEGDNAFAPAADGIIEATHISALDKILTYIRSGKKIILFTFVLSIFYNLAGLFFAVQGTLSPLIAAILMPSSTLTIIGVTFGLSNLLARKHNLNLNHQTI